MAKGFFKIWPVDDTGNPIGDPQDPSAKPKINDSKAVDFYIGLLTGEKESPPQNQLDLITGIQGVVRAIQTLYQRDDRRFRMYYARIFSLGCLGLEGENAQPDIAKLTLASVTADLIDDQAGRVKNDHLRTLGMTAANFAAAFAIAYFVLKYTPPRTLLYLLDIEPDLLANFMLLWIGAMLGVWLSYAIRTTTFTLRDLLITDSDRLVPGIRLFYAGCLTMILGMVLVTGIADIKIGNIELSRIAKDSMLAFLVGTFCGIMELTLPTTVAKRASDFLSSTK